MVLGNDGNLLICIIMFLIVMLVVRFVIEFVNCNFFDNKYVCRILFCVSSLSSILKCKLNYGYFK